MIYDDLQRIILAKGQCGSVALAALVVVVVVALGVCPWCDDVK